MYWLRMRNKGKTDGEKRIRGEALNPPVTTVTSDTDESIYSDNSCSYQPLTHVEGVAQCNYPNAQTTTGSCELGHLRPSLSALASSACWSWRIAHSSPSILSFSVSVNSFQCSFHCLTGFNTEKYKQGWDSVKLGSVKCSFNFLLRERSEDQYQSHDGPIWSGKETACWAQHKDGRQREPARPSPIKAWTSLPYITREHIIACLIHT